MILISGNGIMKQFGAFEAKTHFSEILNNVIKGEKIMNLSAN
jgi:antitoxin (DNA-binding transcriptional repressor) of toxin-antitoxin stability system